MDDQQFAKELGELQSTIGAAKERLKATGDGPSDEQIRLGAPRDAGEVADAVKRHEMAARESSLAEAKFFIGEAMKILGKGGLAAATGGVGGAL